MKSNFNRCVSALRKTRKVEKEIASLWRNYEGRDGSFVEITRAAIDMDYDDDAVILNIDVRWGYYDDNNQNNYQYERTFYIDAEKFNTMYLIGRMEQIAWEEDGE